MVRNLDIPMDDCLEPYYHNFKSTRRALRNYELCRVVSTEHYVLK